MIRSFGKREIHDTKFWQAGREVLHTRTFRKISPAGKCETLVREASLNPQNRPLTLPIF